MTSSATGGPDTGTEDKIYNLTSVLYHALQGVENCEIFGEDADDETRQFFDQACQQQRQIAEQAKRLLHDCLMKEQHRGGGQSGQSSQGGSAFGFGSSGSQSEQNADTLTG